MFLFGNKRRTRFSGMLAGFAQITVGAFFVSHFFKEAPGSVGIGALIFLLPQTLPKN